MYRILICDDERDIVSALKIYLASEDYETLEAYDGEEALDILCREEIHLVLMDIMMPKMDGITAMTRLREQSNVPVILITAKGEDHDKILGLNIGADDYITKPFNPVEVLARVRSHLRRYMQLGGGQVRPAQLVIGNIALDDTTKLVTRDGEPVNLTPTEYDILKLLMSHPRQVFSPAETMSGSGMSHRWALRARWLFISDIFAKNWKSLPPSRATSKWCGAGDIKWIRPVEE